MCYSAASSRVICSPSGSWLRFLHFVRVLYDASIRHNSSTPPGSSLIYFIYFIIFFFFCFAFIVGADDINRDEKRGFIKALVQLCHSKKSVNLHNIASVLFCYVIASSQQRLYRTAPDVVGGLLCPYFVCLDFFFFNSF